MSNNDKDTSLALYKTKGISTRRNVSSGGYRKPTCRDGVDMTWRGTAFQVGAAATGKARSSTADSRVRRKAVTTSTLMVRGI